MTLNPEMVRVFPMVTFPVATIPVSGFVNWMAFEVTFPTLETAARS